MREKTLILVWSVVLAVGGFAQQKDKLPGFLGIPWESSIDKAASLMKDHKELSFGRLFNDSLVYHGTFEARAAQVILVFYKERFCSGMVQFISTTGRAVDLYKNLVTETSKTYGRPTTEIENVSDNDTINETTFEQAIRANKATFFSRWDFQDGNFIIVTVGRSSIQASMSFTNKRLADMKIKS
jgi:hypothetical protein